MYSNLKIYLISPSKLPERSLVKLFGLFASTETPSECPVNDAKNGLANILSIFVATSAL
jgi:hypothetical protein